jgi:hypothetical protein
MRKSNVPTIRRQIRQLERELYAESRLAADPNLSLRLARAADLLTEARGVDLYRLRWRPRAARAARRIAQTRQAVRTPGPRQAFPAPDRPELGRSENPPAGGDALPGNLQTTCHAHGLTARAAILRRGGRDRPRGFCCIRGLARALRARRPRRECDVGMFPISLARSGANCRRRDIGRQAVESVPFVSSEPLLQLRAGQVDVDQGALALADDRGAVDQASRDPLGDASLRDVAHLGKF